MEGVAAGAARSAAAGGQTAARSGSVRQRAGFATLFPAAPLRKRRGHPLWDWPAALLASKGNG